MIQIITTIDLSKRIDSHPEVAKDVVFFYIQKPEQAAAEDGSSTGEVWR